MSARNCLVLSQYRDGSDYKDQVGQHYHFPKRYYGLMTLENIEFVYYEPKKFGAGEYFGYGRIGVVNQDSGDDQLFYAEIIDYVSFEKPVPYKDDDGTNIEVDLQKFAQRAVRKIDDSVLGKICQTGGLDLSTLGSDEENVTSNEPSTEPFDAKAIKIDRELQTIFQVVRRLGFEEKEIELNPDFQRNAIWDAVKKSRLIESVLLRIPLPSFYFNATVTNKWVVVDGLQRLTCFKEYMLDKTLKLQGMEHLTHLEGLPFDQLPRIIQREIEDTPLTLFVIRPETPPKVKFTIFYRLNTGGLVLTAQEIRNALFVGKSTKLLKELSKSDEFLGATLYSISDARMDAQECVLRYLAFRMKGADAYKRSDLNLFLSDTMDEINGLNDDRLEELRSQFKEAMTRANQVLERFAFRKFDLQKRRGPINKALFESWSNCLQEYPLEKLLERKADLLFKIDFELKNNPDYTRFLSGGTGSTQAVKGRFQIARTLIESIIS